MTVKTAALSAEESRQIFDVPLARRGVQAIWFNIENNSPGSVIFLLRSVDPEYFTGREVSYIHRYKPGFRHISDKLPSMFKIALAIPALVVAPVDYWFVRQANRDMEASFHERQLRNVRLAPSTRLSGFAFVPREEGSRLINLVVPSVGRGKERVFTFLAEVPGIKVDHAIAGIDGRYSAEELIDLTSEELRTMLEVLPCCATGPKGDKNADPLNLIVIGDLTDLLGAFRAAGWDETEYIRWSSILKTIGSFSFSKKYRYSPVSAMYYQGRKHDVALQKSRATPHERAHLRLWYTPMRFASKPVWIGQVSRDIGVRFTTKTWNLMTHKIDPDVDESREYVLTDLAWEERVGRFGFVKGVGRARSTEPRTNLTNDVYFTDGLRLVIEASKHRTEIEPFEWEEPVWDQHGIEQN